MIRIVRSPGLRSISRALGGVALTLATGCSGPANTPAAGGESGGAASGAMTATTGASGSTSGSIGTSGSASGTTGATGGARADASTGSLSGVDDGGVGAADATESQDARPLHPDTGADGNAGAGGEAGAGTAGADGGVPLNASLLADCTGTSPIVCAIDVANGNYNVTVQLGSATASATTRVQSELLRIDLQPTSTAAGTFLTDTFTVNVRQEVHSTYSAPGGILNLLFDGTAPALHGLGVAAAPNAVTVFLAGDSTVCDWDPTASDAITPPTPSIERGWGQELSQYLAPGPAVADYAVSGQTAGSFYATYFPQARTAMKAGDYLFIQFGHNDQKSAADIAAYQANLTKYITDARAKSVTPVIFTPVARGTGTDFAGLDQQARDLAAAENVTLVDLTNLAWAYYQTLPDKTVLFVPGQETHFTESGATQIAGIVAQALKASGLALAASVK